MTEYSMNDARRFIVLFNDVKRLDKKYKKFMAKLEAAQDELVQLCPHLEAAEWSSGIRGWGNWRVCKACGLEDRAAIGGTPGDEYNYGTAGHVDRTFWADTTIQSISEKEVNKYRKNHQWFVKGGKAVKV